MDVRGDDISIASTIKANLFASIADPGIAFKITVVIPSTFIRSCHHKRTQCSGTTYYAAQNQSTTFFNSTHTAPPRSGSLEHGFYARPFGHTFLCTSSGAGVSLAVRNSNSTASFGAVS